MPVSGAYIPIFGVCDCFRYKVTFMMHKCHMSLTRVPVAGNRHTLLCAHYKLYTHDSNQPHSVEEALRIDEETGTDFWRMAINKEMKNVMPAFEFHDDDKMSVG